MDDWEFDWDEAGEFDGLVSAAKSEPRHVGYARSVERRRPVMDNLIHLVEQLYYSHLTAPLHCLTFLLATVLLLTTLGFLTPLSGRPHFVLGLEVVVTATLAMEVGLKATVMGRVHLRTWTGALDACIAVVSVGFLIFEAPLAKFRSERREDLELSQSLVMLRILVQFGRLLLLAEHAQRARKKSVYTSLEDLSLDFSALREWELRMQQQEDYDFI